MVTRATATDEPTVKEKRDDAQNGRMIGAAESGFVAPHAGPPPSNLPLRTDLWRRAKPQLELQIETSMLSPATLRAISADIQRQARAAGQRRQLTRREQLDDVADMISEFIGARRAYGEGWNPWR
jgi:hypothetical protein